MTADWLTIDRYSGGTGQTDVYVGVVENERAGGNRFATIRFTNDAGLYADLNVSQTSNTADMSFTITPTYIYVPGGGGTFYANITSNTFWRVVNYNSYLSIASDNPDGFGDATLTISFPANDNEDNWYGYDHNGRPFYGRSGYIYVSSLAGEYMIYWEQAAYNAITVTPSSLQFPQSGGSLTVTVSSSTDWTVTSYDSANVSLSTLSGSSGQTVVTITKSALTQNQIAYYATNPSTIEFNDGKNVALVYVDSIIDGAGIDDDYVTVTYYVPSANTEIEIYGIMEVICESITYDSSPSTVAFQDDYHTNYRTVTERWPTLSVSTRKTSYVTFTTSGYHKVKYKFSDNTLLQRMMFVNNSAVTEIVIGNRCSGVIKDAAVYNATNCGKIVLGSGKITSIGTMAFYNCGSLNEDFVLTNSVSSLGVAAFHNFKARKFIYNRSQLGGGSGGRHRETGNFLRKVYDVSLTRDMKFTATTENLYSWGGFGDLQCDDFIIGQNVGSIKNQWFYPYSFSCYTYYNSVTAITYYEAYVFGLASQEIKYGVRYNKLTSLAVTPPSGTPSSFMAKTNTTVNISGYGTVQKTYGPSTSLPFHYPTGSDYSSWFSTFTNHYGDINL